MDLKKEKSFKCRATLKQTRASAKELEWRQDCFLPQSVILSTPKTNSSQSFFAEISQSIEMLGSSSDRSRWITQEWKYTKNESTSLTAQIKESTVVLVCCMLQPQPLKDKWWRVRTFLSYMNYKNTIRGSNDKTSLPSGYYYEPIHF